MAASSQDSDPGTGQAYTGVVAGLAVATLSTIFLPVRKWRHDDDDNDSQFRCPEPTLTPLCLSPLLLSREWRRSGEVTWFI